jgi:4-hydroxyacetophenone monooxygenase
MQWLLRHVPGYARWYRFWLFWSEGDRNLPLATVEPDWDAANGSVGAQNDRFRALLTEELVAQCQGRPDLASRIIPAYPPFSKRLLLDDGDWVATLRRPSVRLISDPIRAMTAGGIVTADGVEHQADVVIYATGFEASRFLIPIEVRGRAGIDLHRHWAGDARAYLGMTVPGFPNFFLMYGPNTGLVLTGSMIYFSECEIRYIVGCLRLLLDRGHRTMEPRPDVHDAYNREIDAGTQTVAWGVATVNSWYRNKTGRISQIWPFTLLEFWRRTQAPNPRDYVLG